MPKYEVQAQGRQSDVWTSVYFTDDLDAAKRYASGLLAGGRVVAVRVVHQETGEVVGDAQA